MYQWSSSEQSDDRGISTQYLQEQMGLNHYFAIPLNKNYLKLNQQSILAQFSDNLKCKPTLSITNCARFYALPKVHKQNFPFCHIASNIGTASYHLCFLIILLKNLLSLLKIDFHISFCIPTFELNDCLPMFS